MIPCNYNDLEVFMVKAKIIAYRHALYAHCFTIYWSLHNIMFFVFACYYSFIFNYILAFNYCGMSWARLTLIECKTVELAGWIQLFNKRHTNHCGRPESKCDYLTQKNSQAKQAPGDDEHKSKQTQTENKLAELQADEQDMETHKMKQLVTKQWSSKDRTEQQAIYTGLMRREGIYRYDKHIR